MKSINTLILRHFFMQALLPILIIELSLIITLFLLNNYQSEQNKKALEGIARDAFIEIARQTSGRINQHFTQAENTLDQLGNTSEIFLKIQDQRAYKSQNFQRYDGFFQFSPPHVTKNGFLKYIKPKTTSIYTTNLRSLTPYDYSILNSLAALTPITKSILETPNSLITNAWINIDKKYAFAYPPINPFKELKPDLDVTKFSFYYNADPQHNPDRTRLFVPLYTEGWALQNGELGTYVKPIYLSENFMGVVGLTLNVEEIANVINTLDLPFSAHAMLMDQNNTLIASSDSKTISKMFHVESFYQRYKEGVDHQPSAMIVDMKSIEDPRFIQRSMLIKGTDLKIVIFVEKASIFAPIEMLSGQTVKVGITFIIAIALFYLFFFWFNYRSLKTLSKRVTLPLQAIVNFSSQLGRRENFHLEKTKIKELQTLNSNLYKTHQELMNMLIKDKETGLFNRRKLLEDLFDSKASSLLLLHIQNYRSILQYYGQESASALLNEIIATLSEYSDIVLYRIADNELALLSKEQKSSDYNELLSHLNALHVTFNTVNLHPFIFAGVSLVNNTGDELEKATLALQNALDHKVSTPILFKDEFDKSKQYRNNLLWAGRIKEAFSEDRIQPYFQPIYNLKTERIEKFEALVRIEENGEVITPFHFLESVEKMGRLHDITLLMIEKVFKIAVRYPDYTFSINLSTKDIQDVAVLDYIIERCKYFGIKPQQIVFELLETEAVDEVEKSIAFLTELKSTGFAIAIDDFGTGYSNFAHLSMMKADFIKIDGQFIKDITTNPNSAAITKSICEFAGVMGAETIAEFVKDEKTLQAVKALQIDYAQGFVISAAVSEEKIDALLSKFNT